MSKDFYNPNEIAEILGVHVKTIRRYLKDNTIKGVKVGGTWKVSKEELEKYLNTDMSSSSNNSKNNGEEDVCMTLNIELKVSKNSIANKIAWKLMGLINSGNFPNSTFKYDLNRKVAKFVLTGPSDYLKQSIEIIELFEQSKDDF